MKKLLLPLLLLITSCGDIITKIEKDETPTYEYDTPPSFKVDELSHIQVTTEEAKQDILDCALYLYLQNPLYDINLIGQYDYVNSIYRLTAIAKQYAQRNQEEKANKLFEAAKNIANNHLQNDPPWYLSRLNFINQSQPEVDHSKEIQEAAVTSHHKISNSTDKHTIRGWVNNIAPILIQTNHFDLVQDFAPNLFEYDRIKILSKTVIAMASASMMDQAKVLADSLHRDLLNIDNREKRTIPKQKLNSYAHMIGAFHALGEMNVCIQLMEGIQSAIQSEPPLRTRYFIEASRIFASEYQLLDESYALIQLANGNFDSVNSDEVYFIAQEFLDAGLLEEANSIANAIHSSYYHVMFFSKVAHIAYDAGDMDTWNQRIQKITRIIENTGGDTKIYLYYELAKCYAKANEAEKMDAVLMQAIQMLKSDRTITRNTHLIYISEILSEFNFPTSPKLQTELLYFLE